MTMIDMKGKVAAVGSLLLALASGCSLTLDFEECNVDDDCRQIGGGLSCVEGLCVEEGEEPECNGDEDCQARAPRTACVAERCVEPEPEPEPDAPCSTARCAETLGDNFICGVGGVCVSALSAQCNTIVGPIERDNVFLIGSILPTSGQFGGLGLPIQQAAELAAVEFNDASGLPNGQRIVLIGCDEAGDLVQGLAAARHLVETVGVKAIVGPAFSGIYIEVTTNVTVPAGVMTMSPSATSPLITGLDDQGLGWRTVASDVFQGVAIADLVRDLGLQRVTVLNKGDAYGRGLRDRVGQELFEELGEAGLVSLEYADPGEGAVNVGVVSDALGDQPNPEAILLLGTSEALDLMLAYEGAVVEQGLVPPRYILTDGGKDGTRFQELIDGGQVSVELLSRISGTEPDHQNGSNFFSFDLRFKARNNNQPAGVFTANAYDAVYLLAYGSIAAGQVGEVTGATIAASMSRMMDLGGRVIAVGPTDISSARNLLTSGGGFNFEGASGPLDFDLSTGEAPANVALWRPEIRNGDIRFSTARRYEIGPDGRGVWSAEQ